MNPGAENVIRKLQARLVKQKKEEQKLRKDIQHHYGTEDISLEKEQKMNSLNDEISILQRKLQEAENEQRAIQSYQAQAENDEVEVSIREAKKEINLHRLKHKELLKTKSTNQQEREAYFKVI